MKTRLPARVVFTWFAFCVAISTALVYVVQGAFNIDEALHGNVALGLGVCLACQAVLFAEVFRPSWKVVSRIAFAVMAVAACVLAVVFSGSADPVADVPENHLAAAVVFVVVNAIVFALSHRHLTCVLLFGVGSFTCGFVQFLYVTNMLLATIVFAVLALGFVAFRSYLDTASGMGAGQRPLFGQAVLVSLLVPLGAALLASFVVIGIIMPLDPPHATIKLFTQELAYEEEYVKSAVSLTEDAENVVTSSNVDESLDVRTTTDMKLDEDLAQGESSGAPSKAETKDYLSGDYSDVDFSGLSEGVQALALNPSIPWALIIVGLLLLIVLLLTVPRYVVHRARLRRISALEPNEQIGAFYEFFISRFAKLGIGTPRSLTPVEYANGFRDQLYPYVGAQGAATFDHLTALFVTARFQESAVDAEDLRAMRHLYNRFYYNCRKQLGIIKYLFRYITL